MFDPRILRVGIEVNGQANVYDGLFLSASITKTDNPLQNEAQVRIGNLTKETRDYIITETSPFNKSKTPKRLFIEAGRESTGAVRLFIGDITECNPSQPPDIYLSIKAKTAQALKSEIVAVSHGAQEKLSVIARGIASSAKLRLQFEATDKNVSNYSFTGALSKQVEKLAQIGRVNAFIDDDALIVKDNDKAILQTTHVLSKDSGMVGIPELTEKGVKVRYLFDPQSRVGGELEVKSEINPSANGRYAIYTLSYELSNRDAAFYCVAECKRL